MPPKLITTVLLVDELLWMVSCPVVAPVAVGSNCTSSVTARLGFKVTGNVTPDIVKPVPLSVPELMVTGAVPVEVNVTGSVDVVFTVTLSNARLAALTVNVGTAPTAFSCRAKLSETPPALAVSVTVCADVTDDTVAVNPALVAFAATVTVAGTVTAALLLARLTVIPLYHAALVSVTVQVSLPAPVIDALLQESALNQEPRPHWTCAICLSASFVVSVADAFATYPQPGSATTTRQHATIGNSFVHKLSSLRIGLRPQAQYELNTSFTSEDVCCLPEADKKKNCR